LKGYWTFSFLHINWSLTIWKLKFCFIVRQSDCKIILKFQTYWEKIPKNKFQQGKSENTNMCQIWYQSRVQSLHTLHKQLGPGSHGDRALISTVCKLILSSYNGCLQLFVFIFKNSFVHTLKTNKFSHISQPRGMKQWHEIMNWNDFFVYLSLLGWEVLIRPQD
jgi:hypothetical protein